MPRLGLFALLTALLAACGGNSGDSSTSQTAAGTWTLVSIGETTVAAIQPTLTFASVNQLAGFSGCNQYSGAYRRNEASLYVSALAVTRRACAEPGAMEMEQRFIAALESAISIREDNGTLVIESEAEPAPLVFESGPTR
ncbi:MAG: META domain-containing protein [Pseudomonadota bacterium]